MKVIFHLGAHCTDDDRLLRTLLKNRGRLADSGTLVPAPGRYRQVLRDAVNALGDTPPGAAVISFVRDAVIEDDKPERLVLSSEHFMGGPARAIDEGMLYPIGPARVARLRALFPRSDAELFFAICNPATFVPALRARNAELSWQDFIAGGDPAKLSWSGLIARLQSENPGLPITVWCNEDSPIIWPEILRAVGGLQPGAAIAGGFDMIASLMTEAGMRRMRAWIDARQPMLARIRRRTMAAFLEKFANPGALAVDIDLPGWTQDYIDRLTEGYEADIAQIREMPGVRILMA